MQPAASTRDGPRGQSKGSERDNSRFFREARHLIAQGRPK